MITLLLTEPPLVLEPQLPPDLPDLADLSERLGEAGTRWRGYGDPGHSIVTLTGELSLTEEEMRMERTHLSPSHCDVAAPVVMLPGAEPKSN